MLKVPEKYRLGFPHVLATLPNSGNNGAFKISIRNGVTLQCICTDGHGWEHVSVVAYQKRKVRTPTWDEMCHIKDLFWDKEDRVVQYHPPESEYVNNHPHCLHLWRPIVVDIPAPPSYLVGIKQ